MKRPNRVAVIGGGGIACALLPILSRMMHCVIIDKDVYEPANVARQFPALTKKGNKAEVLAGMLAKNTTFQLSAIPEFLEDLSMLNNPLFQGIDLIVGAVDNNESRHIIMELALTMGIPAFLGGNEHEHGEAHAFYPGIYDPTEHHDFSGGDPAPFHCNTDKTVEEFPQTPIANAMAAGAILHLLLSYEKAENLKNAVCYTRLDPFSGVVKRVRDYALAEA
jgi:molybdopterin/thiamine biosynthesis adenylyltransferase